MSINVSEVISHFENLHLNGAIYVWGANGQVITEQLCNNLYNTFKPSSTYNKQYYQNKYKEGKGKIGADCSGAFYPVSGFDTTAQGYYNKCSIKGKIESIPRDKPCMVFKGKSTSKITHIGFYLGDGYVIEMKSSQDNCVHDKLDGRGWKWYGVPDWIDYSKDDEDEFDPYVARTVSDLNLRNTPSSTYRTNVITVIPKNTYISVVGSSVGAWVKAQCVIYNQEYTGYVSSKYLYPFDTTNREKRQVTTWGLNARTGQGITHDKVFTMNKNDVFTVVNKEKWGLILYDNKLGYANVSNAYSKKL